MYSVNKKPTYVLSENWLIISIYHRFEGTNVKNLAILTQYYLQHIAGIFKSTKSEKGGQGPIPNPSIATQGHAWVSDGWYWVAKSIKILKKKKKKKIQFFFFFKPTQYQPSETHACPCVAIDGFGIGPGLLFSDFVDLKVPAICCR